MPSKTICGKCGKEWVENNVEISTSVYFYRGTGNNKQRANTDLCIECMPMLTKDFKYPIDFQTMPQKNRQN